MTTHIFAQSDSVSQYSFLFEYIWGIVGIFGIKYQVLSAYVPTYLNTYIPYDLYILYRMIRTYWTYCTWLILIPSAGCPNLLLPRFSLNSEIRITKVQIPIEILHVRFGLWHQVKTGHINNVSGECAVHSFLRDLASCIVTVSCLQAVIFQRCPPNGCHG